VNEAYAKEAFWRDPDVGILFVRIAAGGLLFLHGWHKIFAGIENQMGMLANAGLPPQLMYFVYISELLAPLLIVLGMFVRLSAITVIVTLLTVLYVLPVDLLSLNERTGASNIEIQLFYLLTAIALFCTGPGRIRLRANPSGHWLLD
jgi:putative oxidoreductase